MKQLLWGSALAVLVAACGGGSKPPPTEPEPKKSACAAAAENVVKLLGTADSDVPADKIPDVMRVFTERCEADKWSDEVVACITNAKTPDPDLERCEPMLTEEQKDAVDDQIEREVLKNDADKAMEAPGRGDMEGGSGAKPPPAPPPPDDPCGGGA